MIDVDSRLRERHEVGVHEIRAHAPSSVTRVQGANRCRRALWRQRARLRHRRTSRIGPGPTRPRLPPTRRSASRSGSRSGRKSSPADAPPAAARRRSSAMGRRSSPLAGWNPRSHLPRILHRLTVRADRCRRHKGQGVGHRQRVRTLEPEHARRRGDRGSDRSRGCDALESCTPKNVDRD